MLCPCRGRVQVQFDRVAHDVLNPLCPICYVVVVVSEGKGVVVVVVSEGKGSGTI
jgi:hypothetical protein